MSTPSAALPERAVRPRPPMALEHRFFVFDVPDASQGPALTNARVRAMLDGHAQARWIVLRSRRGGAALHYVCRPDALRAILAARPDDKSFGATLRSAPLTPAATMDLARWRSADGLPAIVVEDGVMLGVAVPRNEATRALKGLVPVAEPAAPQALDAEQAHRLDAFMPAELRLDATATLVVTLDRLGGTPGAADLALRVGEPLEITVQGDACVQPVGENTRALGVPADRIDGAVAFTFQARAVGEARVKVFAFRAGRSVARLVLTLRVVAGTPHAPAGAPAWDDAPLCGALPAAPPDLRLLVLEGGGQVRFQLWAGAAKLADYAPVGVHDLARYARQFAESVDALAIGQPDSAAIARRKLEAWGAALFRDLIPQDLQTLLVAQREAITLQICSDEAWIPWEACRLLRYGQDGAVEEGAFFAEAFAMTRWLHGTPAPARFRTARCALVVPSGTGLDMAEQERAYCQGRASAQRVVEPIAARYLPLTEAMASGRFDAWHFCGHASAGTAADGDQAALRLEGNESMSADLFAGTVENALLPQPFIFFNACQSAVGGQSLTGIGGWAARLIRPSRGRRGAAAFIGTYWSVYDVAAHRFATALYGALDQGQPIGAAVRGARQAARQAPGGAPADPLSWLAYTVYADPLAVQELP